MPRLITPQIAYKHLKRYRQVVNILVKYGFGQFIGQIRFWEYINIERRLLHRQGEVQHLNTAIQMRLALEELGPTFVKLGQMLSTRPDIVPPEYIVELEKLQNRVAPVPGKVGRSIIESELGQPVDQVFSWFDDQPSAAASLAQVHRARYDGNEVIVKVQRPGITDIIEIDLDILHNLAALAQRYLPAAYVLNLVGLVQEFTDNIRRELDFRIEARNMERFAENFKDIMAIHVPRVYLNLCTHRVIVMEYINGINISDVKHLKEEGCDLELIAKRGVDIGFKSIMEFGFFHADPHPGNIIVLPGNVICLLDFGMMGTVSPRQREGLGKLLYNISNQDEKRVARAVLELMESNEEVDAEELEPDIARIIEQYATLSLKDINLGAILNKMLSLLTSHRLRFNTHLIWLAKTITNYEDIAHRLYPDFNVVAYSKPYARHLLKQQLSPWRQSRELYQSFLDLLELMKDLPYDLGVILDLLKKGKAKIEFEHRGLEPIRRTFNRASNRLAVTLVLAAIIIASALIVSSGVPPLLGSIPILGIAGFGISIVIAGWLLFAMIFNR